MKWLQKILGIDLSTSDQVIQAEQLEEQVLHKLISEKQAEQAPIGALHFTLRKSGNIHVVCEWDEKKPAEEIGALYAQLIHHVCVGSFANTIKQILTEQVNQNIQLQSCVKAIFAKWQALMEEHDNDPVIHPMRVFGMTDSIRGAHGPEPNDDDSGEDIEIHED